MRWKVQWQLSLDLIIAGRQRIGTGDTPPADEWVSKWWSPEKRMRADTHDGRDCQCKTSLLLPLLSFLYSFIYSSWRQALFKGLGMAQQTKRRVVGRLLEEGTEPGVDVVRGESRRNLGDNSPGGHARCVFRELQGGLRFQAERWRQAGRAL